MFHSSLQKRSWPVCNSDTQGLSYLSIEGSKVGVGGGEFENNRYTLLEVLCFARYVLKLAHSPQSLFPHWADGRESSEILTKCAGNGVSHHFAWASEPTRLTQQACAWTKRGSYGGWITFRLLIHSSLGKRGRLMNLRLPVRPILQVNPPDEHSLPAPIDVIPSWS